LRSVSGRCLARAVERKGWVLLRVHGSHHIYGRSGDTARLSIPVHHGRDLKAGLLAHLMRIAGVSFDDL
jgi:predicted RNA binding protein YcfA (HicA-like mRNA interferase family)